MLNHSTNTPLAHRALVVDDSALMRSLLAGTLKRRPATIAHMRLAGFNDFLFKPFKEHVLDGILEEVIVRH